MGPPVAVVRPYRGHAFLLFVALSLLTRIPSIYFRTYIQATRAEPIPRSVQRQHEQRREQRRRPGSLLLYPNRARCSNIGPRAGGDDAAEQAVDADAGVSLPPVGRAGGTDATQASSAKSVRASRSRDHVEIVREAEAAASSAGEDGTECQRCDRGGAQCPPR
mmetsp:Transcript_26209/g.53157  ORF Transcript_26209/g.53157 Transcript_26209/m.53157 type:complete len:163 (+) Transcript_26209:259-747(+)